jgi:hypothetical protein
MITVILQTANISASGQVMTAILPIMWTLQPRVMALTLPEREFELTLQEREFSFTLDEREFAWTLEDNGHDR